MFLYVDASHLVDLFLTTLKKITFFRFLVIDSRVVIRHVTRINNRVDLTC